MAGSMGRQDKVNPVFLLATRVGKMGLSYPLRISCFVSIKAKFFGVICWPYNKSFVDRACSVKMAGYWPHSFFLFFFLFFLHFYGPRLCLGA